jgi:hypothetical protein
MKNGQQLAVFFVNSSAHVRSSNLVLFFLQEDVEVADPKGAVKAAAADDEDEDEDEDLLTFGQKDDQAAPTASKGTCRFYDATITYDIYYNSPRLYLRGYAEVFLSCYTFSLSFPLDPVSSQSPGWSYTAHNDTNPRGHERGLSHL